MRDPLLSEPFPLGGLHGEQGHANLKRDCPNKKEQKGTSPCVIPHESKERWTRYAVCDTISTRYLRDMVGARRTVRQEKRAQTQTLGPDLFRWGGGLPRAGVGDKKGSVCPSEPRRTKRFGQEIPGCPKRLRKKGFNSRSLNWPTKVRDADTAILIKFAF